MSIFQCKPYSRTRAWPGAVRSTPAINECLSLMVCPAYIQTGRKHRFEMLTRLNAKCSFMMAFVWSTLGPRICISSACMHACMVGAAQRLIELRSELVTQAFSHQASTATFSIDLRQPSAPAAAAAAATRGSSTLAGLYRYRLLVLQLTTQPLKEESHDNTAPMMCAFPTTCRSRSSWLDLVRSCQSYEIMENYNLLPVATVRAQAGRHAHVHAVPAGWPLCVIYHRYCERLNINCDANWCQYW